MRNNGPVASSPRSSRNVVSAPGGTNLGDLLELVLDKGLVIAGDITLFLGGVQLLTLKIRLLIASIDKAQEIGINWWQSDPALSSRASARAKDLEHAEQERNLLTERLDRLERLVLAPPQEGDQEHAEEHAEAGQRSNAALVLDQKSTLSAELTLPLQQAPEEEQPHALERAPQPGAVPAEQPAGAGSLLGSALHEHLAQAMRPILGELEQRIVQTVRQQMEQARPEG